MTIGDLLGDGSNGSADNALQPGEMIRSIELAAPLQGERALYKRAISRTHAEWPLVEICARAVIKDGAFQFIRLAAGGIAPVPLRLAAAEAALQGKPANIGDDCRCRRTRDIGCKAVADDGIQARSAEGRRAGSAGAISRVACRMGGALPKPITSRAGLMGIASPSLFELRPTSRSTHPTNLRAE